MCFRYGFKLDQVYSSTQDNGTNFILAGNLLKYNETALGNEEENYDSEEEEEEVDDDDNEEEGPDDGEDGEWEDDDEFIDGHSAEDDITELDGVQVIRCAAHTVALAVDDTLKKMKKRLYKFRKLAKYLRRPTIISEIKRKNLKVPKLDNKTRWNSKYNMMLSLKNLRNYCQSKNITHLNLTDWAFCDMFLEVFEPVKAASITLQKEQLSLADFFKCWVNLSLKIKKISQKVPLALLFYKKMLLREAKLLGNNRSVEAALYLDPRFNQVFTKMRPNYFNVERAQQHLLELYKHLRKIEVS